MSIDLSQFELQSPIKKGDGILIIPADKLLEGFTAEYFYYNPDASATFMCPTNGATTENAKYPRCELRERREKGEWSLKGSHVLDVACRVNKLAGGKGVIIGQIHGTNSKMYPQLVKLFWRNDNSIMVECRDDKDPTKHVQHTFGTYKLGELINYLISVDGEDVTICINSVGTHTSTRFSFKNKYWTKQKYYFKVGNYLQNNKGDDLSLVTFSRIRIVHKD